MRWEGKKGVERGGREESVVREQEEKQVVCEGRREGGERGPG